MVTVAEQLFNYSCLKRIYVPLRTKGTKIHVTRNYVKQKITYLLFKAHEKLKFQRLLQIGVCLFTGSCLKSLRIFLDQDQYLEVKSLIIFKRPMNCLWFG